jgi:hypothetical protein
VFLIVLPLLGRKPRPSLLPEFGELVLWLDPQGEASSAPLYASAKEFRRFLWIGRNRRQLPDRPQRVPIHGRVARHQQQPIEPLPSSAFDVELRSAARHWSPHFLDHTDAVFTITARNG